MFDDILEMEGLIPTAIIYVLVTIMMWYIFGYWARTTETVRMSWITRIMFQIILIPLCYVIVNYYKNKE